MALSADTQRVTAGEGTRLRMPGANANVFYAGAYVQVDRSTGLVNEAADTANFVGFGIVQRHVTGDAASGSNEVEILAGPFRLIDVNVTGVDNINDIGDPVYATADDTLTLSSTSNTKPIGVVVRYYGSSTKCDVAVYPAFLDQAF